VSREAFAGGEFDWFAVDGAGPVGYFATAGYGLVPAAILARFTEPRELDERVLGLPTRAGAPLRCEALYTRRFAS
jgi:hypothetical protein